MIRPDLFKIVRAALAAIFSLLIACTSDGKNAELFAHDIEVAARGLKVGEILRMELINNGKWDRMFLFPPYTPIQDIEAALKSKAPSSVIESRISERDDANLLIFMNGSEVQIVVAVIRSAVDFSIPSTQPLAREHALFRKPISGDKLVWVDGK